MIMRTVLLAFAAYILVAGCLLIIFNFIAEDFTVIKSFQIYPGERTGDLAGEELEWIVATIIETQRYDCDYHSENLVMSRAVTTHSCLSLEGSLQVQYQVENTGIVLQLSAQESRIKALNVAAEALVSDFDAANLHFDIL